MTHFVFKNSLSVSSLVQQGRTTRYKRIFYIFSLFFALLSLFSYHYTTVSIPFPLPFEASYIKHIIVFASASLALGAAIFAWRFCHIKELSQNITHKGIKTLRGCYLCKIFTQNFASLEERRYLHHLYKLSKQALLESERDALNKIYFLKKLNIPESEEDRLCFAILSELESNTEKLTLAFKDVLSPSGKP